MKRRGTFFVLCLSVVLLPTSAAGPTFAAGPTSGDDDLRVLTFNVWHGLRSGESRKRFPGEDEERRELRQGLQFQALRRLDADVLILQEVNPAKRLAKRYAAELGFDVVYKTTSCGLHLGAIYKIPRNVNEGLAILARPELDLQRVASTRLSGNANCGASWGFQTRESRYGLLASVRLGRREVLIVATHLSSPLVSTPRFDEHLQALVDEGAIDAEQRDDMLERLKKRQGRNVSEARALLDRVAKATAKHDFAAVVLGGDFNTEPGTEGAAAIEERGMFSASAGLSLTTFDPGVNAENYVLGSRRSEDFLYEGGIEEVAQALLQRRRRPRQIDHLFASRGVTAHNVVRVFDEPVEGIYLSDHFGLVATFEIP